MKLFHVKEILLFYINSSMQLLNDNLKPLFDLIVDNVWNEYHYKDVKRQEDFQSTVGQCLQTWTDLDSKVC